ncbi:MAG: rhodanese-like domain-containing protein [Filifactoraceae bacterium]
MKKFSLFLFLVLFILVLGGCSEQEASDTTATYEKISTEDVAKYISNKDWVIVDARQNDAFNGWALDGVSRGGHIEGAVDFSGNWLNVDNKESEAILSEALNVKGILPEKNIIVYDVNGSDGQRVIEYLAKKGYKNLYSYDLKEWVKDDKLPLVKFEGYKYIVPAVVVNDILDGKKPETFENAKNIKMVEASWGEETESYLKGHIPTAIHINTDSIEPPPAWMLADDKTLLSVLLEKGISAEDTVIVSSQSQIASYRVALVLRYAGVKDVRVLNGGTNAYVSAGYKLDTDSVMPKAITDFGGTFPGNPDIIETIPEVKEKLKNPDFTLVDNRTWDEYIGKISGYSYHDKMGRIEGAKFGYAGKGDSSSLDYYRNIDGTMRNPKEIEDMWKANGIDSSKHLIFMCGSGWRAAEVLYYANVAGLDKVSLYSDGWIGWSNANLPSVTGEP